MHLHTMRGSQLLKLVPASWLIVIISCSLGLQHIICMRLYTFIPPASSPPSSPMFSVKPFCLHGSDYTVYYPSADTKRRIQSRKQQQRGSERAHAGLICQPCETMGQGLVMWFRWVSHAGVSQPSPLSAPATVPHYTPCHHRLHLQQALWSLTQGHPFFFSVSLLKRQKGMREEGKERGKKICTTTI